jgi:hypothetical protein
MYMANSSITMGLMFWKMQNNFLATYSQK